ncbi:NAD(P)H-binding protein [Gorillibacterium sp. CAU 1737]|uniref:NAD(P)H-binding protein n=1 Tax=Gorillibacterium sp. CAU 1737 TaxID=3140362 RepID=UPI0032618A29
MTIAITGASGQLGSLIVDHLLRRMRPDAFIACVRCPDSAERYGKMGVPVRLCDYDVPESLEHGFEGVSKLLLISSPHSDDAVRLRQHQQVIEAARKAKVKHLLYTSFAFLENGSGSPVELHRATEQAIRESTLSYTFLRNALYIDFVGALDLSGALMSGQLRVPPGNWRFHSVTRSDLAEATAILLSEEGHVGKTYELTAPQAWTFENLAAALSVQTGREVVVQEDAAVQGWIYSFLRRIDTASVSRDLEQLLNHAIQPLEKSLTPFIRA